jgi:hypothetical protein
MSSLNISVLGAARETYTEQLRIHLTPLLYEGFVSLYEDAKRKESETPEYNGNYLKQFQKLLCDIPYWNQSILEEETRRILHEVDFLMELVAAIFVSHVKILASVRLGGNNSNIRIKIPTSDIFVHTVYCKAAEILYYNPYKFQNYNDRENNEFIKSMLDKSITDTINTMIPIESILKEYLSKVFTGHVKETSHSRQVEQLPVESPGHLLNHQDLGLPDDISSIGSTPHNNEFGAGGEEDNFPSDDLEVGKTSLYSPLDPFGKGEKDSDDIGTSIPFRDDDTVADIFSDKVIANDDPIGKPTDDPFGKPTDDPFGKPIDDPFGKPMDDPFGKPMDDPFGKPIDDPFGKPIDDPFGKSTDDNPTPPELKDELFASKPEEIKFFDDLP